MKIRNKAAKSGSSLPTCSRWQRRGNPRSWSYTGESSEWTDHDDPEQLAVGTGPKAEAVARRNAEFYTRITDTVEYRGLNTDGSVAWQYPKNAPVLAQPTQDSTNTKNEL